MSGPPLRPSSAAILASKKPIAPAPSRYASTPAIGSSLAKPTAPRPIQLAEDDLSDDSSDEEVQLISRTGSSVGAVGYAELGASGGAEEGGSEDEEDGEGEMAGGGGDDDEDSAERRDELIRERVATSQEQMRSILSTLTEEQLQRYETFRRVGFPRPMIKKLINRIMESLLALNNNNSNNGVGAKDKAATNINPSTVIVIAGIAKVFVGELVEEAKVVLEEWGDDLNSPITPAHLMEAHRRLKYRNLIPQSIYHVRRNPLL